MNRKIKEKFESYDLKSFILTVIFFGAGIAIFFYFTNIRERFREDDEKAFQGKASVKIISVETVDKITQGRKGTKIEIESYKVVYTYVINNKEYDNTDFIPNTITNQELIRNLLNKSSEGRFTAKFDINDPEKSILINEE